MDGDNYENLILYHFYKKNPHIKKLGSIVFDFKNVEQFLAPKFFS